jgi:ribonuclease inhibitor
MKEIRLNGAKMVDKAATHAYLKRKLSLPDYYGENLDALWDCLSTDASPKKITVDKPALIIENLGEYGESLLKLFREIAAENGCIEVNIVNEKRKE